MKHPAFYTLSKLAVRAELRARGYKFFEINDVIAGIDDDVIDVAAAQTNAVSGVQDATVGAIGDGAILKAITEFLKSDLGKALVAAILALLGL